MSQRHAAMEGSLGTASTSRAPWNRLQQQQFPSRPAPPRGLLQPCHVTLGALIRAAQLMYSLSSGSQSMAEFCGVAREWMTAGRDGVAALLLAPHPVL